jgi:hypothetical protein
MISQQERVVAVHQVERDDWDDARLDIRAALPEIELASRPWTDVTCVAVLAEGATNSRVVTQLREVSGGGWSGSLAFSRAAYRRRADLSVSVVATVSGVAGRVVGSSEDNWIVDLVARSPERRRELNINEVDFRDGGHEWLRPYRDAPWLVETSGDVPTVHLNAGFGGIVELLHSSGDPTEKVVRDMIAAQIAGEAWTAMFHSAVSDLEMDEEGDPQWPSGWRGWVLRSMLPDVLPDLSATDALSELHIRRAQDTGWNELQLRIQYAASRRARVAKNVGSAVSLLDRSGEGSR